MATLKIKKRPQILAHEVKKHVKPQFNFQGSQILHVRVAISRSDVMIQNKFHHWMLGKLPACNTTVSDFMGDF